jgi:hypothetical protein
VTLGQREGVGVREVERVRVREVVAVGEREVEEEVEGHLLILPLTLPLPLPLFSPERVRVVHPVGVEVLDPPVGERLTVGAPQGVGVREVDRVRVSVVVMVGEREGEEEVEGHRLTLPLTLPLPLLLLPPEFVRVVHPVGVEVLDPPEGERLTEGAPQGVGVRDRVEVTLGHLLPLPLLLPLTLPLSVLKAVAVMGGVAEGGCGVEEVL